MSSRYSRQELVIGSKAQAQLEKARVVVVGLGALGSVASDLFARAGIGSLSLIDRDVVELSNLQRQTLYSEEDVGKPKSECAKSKLRQINSKIILTSHITDLNHQNIDSLLKDNDLIMDCTDNLYTRFLINEFSRKTEIPWVYSAVIKDHGNVLTITKDTPCLRCVFGEPESVETCDTIGVLNTITNAIASIAVNEAIKILSNQFTEQDLVNLNITTLRLTKITPEYGSDCPACNANYEYLSGKKEPRIKEICAGSFQFYFEHIDIKELATKLNKLGKTVEGKNYIFFENLSVFDNGRIFVKADSLEQAKSTISRYIGN
jgi:adenylyltransferase/sulfurtransferase